MKIIIVLLLITIALGQAAPPIAANDKKWVRSTLSKTNCRADCGSEGGHVCAGLHKQQCCQPHFCIQDDKSYNIWNCRSGFEIHVDSCNESVKRDAGFLQTKQ